MKLAKQYTDLTRVLLVYIPLQTDDKGGHNTLCKPKAYNKFLKFYFHSERELIVYSRQFGINNSQKSLEN